MYPLERLVCNKQFGKEKEKVLLFKDWKAGECRDKMCILASKVTRSLSLLLWNSYL